MVSTAVTTLLTELDHRLKSQLESNDPAKRRSAMALSQKPLEERTELVLLDLADRLVRAAAEDALNDRMIWLRVGTHHALDTLLLETFQGWDESAHQKQSAHFYSEVIDEMLIRIERWMQFAIPERSWNIWSLRTIGQDLLMEKGEDYRVVDWTRRMESGEWTDSLVSDSHLLDDNVEQANETAQKAFVSQIHADPNLQHMLRMILDQVESGMRPNREQFVLSLPRRVPYYHG